jgi:hypothetical protein
MKRLLGVLLVMGLFVTINSQLAFADHWENVWVEDQPRHWEVVPVLIGGRVRYESKEFPPTGHYERVLVQDNVLVQLVYSTFYYPYDNGVVIVEGNFPSNWSYSGWIVGSPPYGSVVYGRVYGGWDHHRRNVVVNNIKVLSPNVDREVFSRHVREKFGATTPNLGFSGRQKSLPLQGNRGQHPVGNMDTRDKGLPPGGQLPSVREIGGHRNSGGPIPQPPQPQPQPLPTMQGRGHRDGGSMPQPLPQPQPQPAMQGGGDRGHHSPPQNQFKPPPPPCGGPPPGGNRGRNHPPPPSPQQHQKK